MSNQKSIAVVCNYQLNPDRIGGMDRFFKAYNSEMLEQGHQITWFFCGHEIPEFYAGLNIILAKDCLVEDEVLKFLKSKKAFDIVVTHFTALCTSFYRDLKRSGVEKAIAVDHNPRPLNGFPLKKRLKNKAKGLLYGKYIDSFVGVSEYSKQHLLKDFGMKLEYKTFVIHNGIDKDIYERKEKYEFPVKKFLITSHLRKEKGIQDVITSLGCIKPLGKYKFIIDIYGSGPNEKKLKCMVQELKLTKFINFKGSIPNLHEIYSKYDYLIQPSHGETFCFSIVESLFCGLPVITTEGIGNVLNLVKNNQNGFLYKVNQLEELQKILLGLIKGEKKVSGPFLEKEKINHLNLGRMVEEHVKLTTCI